MQLLLTVGVLTIAAILFYKVVEPRHKVLVGKVLLGGTILVALAIFVSGDAERQRKRAGKLAERQKEKVRQAVTVQFVRDSIETTNSYGICGLYPGGSDGCPQDTTRALRFRICNQSSETLTSVTFSPLTAVKGRSTEYGMVMTSRPLQQAQPHPVNQLVSDYILPPKRCSEITWSGVYFVRDSVFARIVDVTLQ